MVRSVLRALDDMGRLESAPPRYHGSRLEHGFLARLHAGAAYGKYFASPETMFPVWKREPRLEMKSLVFGVPFAGAAKAYPLDLLLRERVINDAVGPENVALVADPVTRAVRVYRRDGRRFAEGPEGLLVEPSTGVLWVCREEGLVPGREREGNGPSLTRLPGHRAFWFGWYAFFPETEVYAGCAAEGPEER